MTTTRALVVASGLAFVMGAGAAIVSAKGDQLLRAVTWQAPGKQVEAAALATAAQPVAGVTTKRIPMATLQVEDASGRTNDLIPLALEAAPAMTGSDILLKISGLPESAYLTSGQRESASAWTLSLDDLKDVKLVVPRASTRELALDVAAVETRTGELAAPIKTLNVALADISIEPASAPPPSQTAAKTSIEAVAKDAVPIPLPQSIGVPQLIATANGDTLLQTGDIAGARRAYEVAWTQGDARAALGLARSYDPLLLGDSPGGDRAAALLWYQRAAEHGETEAAKALLRLKLKP